MSDRAADLRLRRTYGITLEDYRAMLAFQKNGCAICGKPKVNLNLSVDHDHAYDKVRPKVTKIFHGRWEAAATLPDGFFVLALGADRKGAKELFRRLVRRRSVRGLLCAWCNRGLRFYHDNPELLESAARYLRTKNERTEILRNA